jgi:sialidase-1
VTPHLELVTVCPCSEARPRTDTASMVQLADGRLLLTYHGYRAGPDGGGDFGDAAIYARESADQGATWTDEGVLVENEPGDINVMVPSLLLLDGQVLLACSRNHTRTDSSLELRRSTDGGQTFGAPTSVWRHCGEHRFSGYDGLSRLQDGRLLLMMQSSAEIWSPGEKQWVDSYISDDDGATWQLQGGRIDLPMRGAMEPSVVQMADGELICSLRNQLGRVFITRSQNCGTTWNLPQPSGPISPESCTCLMLVPHTERLVLFWNNSPYIHHHHHLGLRTPLSIATSDDRGRTFQHLLDVESAPAGEYTNLTCCFLADGRAALTYMAGLGAEPGDFNRTCLELKLALIPPDQLTGDLPG